jgi:hypothetical protein
MRLLRSAVLRIFLASPLWVGCVAAQQWSGSEHVFGTFLGRTITYRNASRPAAEAAATALRGGQPGVPPDEAEVAQAQARLECGTITGQIRDAVLALLIQEKGISVSEAELDEQARARSLGAEFQAAAERQQALNAAMAEGLSLVYDHGENPDTVYESSQAVRGYSRATWESYLAQGKSASFRVYLSQAAGRVPKPPDTALRAGLRPALEVEKLDRAIDRDLAANDQLFETYVAEMEASKAAHPDGHSFTMSTDHYRYVRAKREAWWKARYSDLDVTVSDREEAGRCDIAALGLRVHSEN